MRRLRGHARRDHCSASGRNASRGTGHNAPRRAAAGRSRKARMDRRRSPRTPRHLALTPPAGSCTAATMATLVLRSVSSQASPQTRNAQNAGRARLLRLHDQKRRMRPISLLPRTTFATTLTWTPSSSFLRMQTFGPNAPASSAADLLCVQSVHLGDARRAKAAASARDGRCSAVNWGRGRAAPRSRGGATADGRPPRC